MTSAIATLRPVFSLGAFGGAYDRCRAMDGKLSPVSEIIAACRAAAADAVLCDADGAPVAAVIHGEVVACSPIDAPAFGARVLHHRDGRWTITAVSGVTPAWTRDGYCRVDVPCGQADARFSALRALQG